MKFERRYTDELETVEIWYFDYSKHINGPYKVDIQYSKQAIEEFKSIRNKKKRKA